MEMLSRRLHTPSEPPIELILLPFHRFASRQASGGIVLLLCTIAALVWANSPLGHSYEELWETHLAIGFENFVLDEPLHFWINDALMAIFFFVVGLEIKRALLVGELESLRRAALPVFAALGGMIVPATLYLLLNAGTEGARGWGIPMATDIAFSLGVMALLGSRVPVSLKLFLTAFAIVDDIGAVAVIAIFYTESLNWVNLAVGVGLMGVLFAASWAGVRHPIVYALIGAVVWVAFLKSGIHATVAGVAVATAIPLRVRIDTAEFVSRGRALLDEFEHAGSDQGSKMLLTYEQRAALEELDRASMDAEPPLQRLEHTLHPWVAFFIMPVFALANAGVVLDGNIIDMLTQPVALGVIVGLLIGKSIGISIFSFLAVRTGLAARPQGVSWGQIFGVAILGGIGFTMSIFITGLAFTNAVHVAEAKAAILGASLVAGVVGYSFLRTRFKQPDESEAAPLPVH